MDDAALYAAATAALDGAGETPAATPEAAPDPAAASSAKPDPAPATETPAADPAKPEGEDKPKPEVSADGRKTAADIRRELAEKKAQREAAKTQPPAAAPERAREETRAPTEAEMAHRLRVDPIGAIKALGFDPLEFFDTFRQAAKDPKVVAERAKQTDVAKGLDELRAELKAIKEANEAATLRESQAKSFESAKAEFLAVTESKAGDLHKYPLTAKLKPEFRMKRALAIARELQQDGITDTDDATLCRLVEADLTEELDGLLPANTPVEPTQPIDRGATAQEPAGKPKPTTLRNDLAAQRAGKPPELTDEERYAKALELLEE